MSFALSRNIQIYLQKIDQFFSIKPPESRVEQIKNRKLAIYARRNQLLSDQFNHPIQSLGVRSARHFAQDED